MLFQHIPLISNYYYKEDMSSGVALVEVRMWVQMAEMYLSGHSDLRYSEDWRHH